VPHFDMPVEVQVAGQSHFIYPTVQWQGVLKNKVVKQIIVDPDYYVGYMNVLGK
jgi:hypothetical protein